MDSKNLEEMLKRDSKDLEEILKRDSKNLEEMLKRDSKDLEEILKRDSKKFGRNVKKGFESIVEKLKLENTRKENQLTNKMCHVPRDETQKEAEGVSILTNVAIYAKDSKKFNLRNLKLNGKDYFLDSWETNMIYEKNAMKAMLLVNHQTLEFLVCMRGTVKTSASDWIMNLKLAKKRNPWGKGKVHKGFLEEVKLLVNYSKFKNTVDELLKKGFNVILTGHSQGASEASVLGSYIYHRIQKLNIQKPDIRIVLFAPPRPGDKTFAVDLMEKIPNIIRIQNQKDLFPRLPSLLRFHHVGKLSLDACSGNPLACHSLREFYPDLQKFLKGYLPSKTTLCKHFKVFKSVC